MDDLIATHSQWLRAGGTAKSTVHDRERLLTHADDHLPYGLDEAHHEELADYLDNPRWSQWTLATYDAHLRGYYGWAVANSHLTINPMLALRRPPEGERLPDPCTDEELARLLAELPVKPWRLLILLCAYEGFRVSEAARLCRVDITEERIRIRRGKGRKDAYVETHPIVWAEVKDLPLREADGKTPFRVVRDPDGSAVTGYKLTNRSWYWFRKLGMPEMRIHRLRHWHATSLLRGGADLETVRQCMRHASIVSTVGYTLIASKERRAAVHRLPIIAQHEPVSTRLVPATEVA